MGLPMITRSASGGTASGPSRKPSAAASTTRSTAWPAARRAASGSVNCGWTTTARRRSQGLGDQHERLCGAGGEQHLAGGTAVPGGDGAGRRGGVRVARQVVERLPDRGVEPRWTGRPAHVDRQVDEAGRRLDVAVVPQIVVLHRNSMRDAGRSDHPAGDGRLTTSARFRTLDPPITAYVLPWCSDKAYLRCHQPLRTPPARRPHRRSSRRRRGVSLGRRRRPGCEGRRRPRQQHAAGSRRGAPGTDDLRLRRRRQDPADDVLRGAPQVHPARSTCRPTSSRRSWPPRTPASTSTTASTPRASPGRSWPTSRPAASPRAPPR